MTEHEDIVARDLLNDVLFAMRGWDDRQQPVDRVPPILREFNGYEASNLREVEAGWEIDVHVPETGDDLIVELRKTSAGVIAKVRR